MIEYNVFPEGKKRIVTFSFDDGLDNDKQLVSLFDKYGMKCTFNLTGCEMDDAKIQEFRARYIGHEIACHTVHHGTLNNMPLQTIVEETMPNRKLLEKIAKYPVVGMALPSNADAYNEDVKTAMKMCGILYMRAGWSTKNFYMPEDFLEWHSTCHHKDAMELADQFLADIDNYFTGPLFMIKGHSWEFNSEKKWEAFENLLKRLTGNEKIWYATSMEIYKYVTAQKSLMISADETIFYNPTTIPVWVVKNKKQIIEIPAGATIILDKEA